MLDAGRLDESIDELVRMHNTELQEKHLWEMWLHKEFEGHPTWEQFRHRHLHPEQYKKSAKQGVNMDDFEAIVKKSRDLMNSFCSSEK
jgi:hypothetical protein